MFVFRLLHLSHASFYFAFTTPVSARRFFMAVRVYRARLGGERPLLMLSTPQNLDSRSPTVNQSAFLYSLPHRLGCYEDITCHSHEARIIFPSTSFSIFIVVISRRLLPLLRGSEALLRLALRLHATRPLRRGKNRFGKHLNKLSPKSFHDHDLV